MPDYQYKPVPNEARTFPHNCLWSAPRSGNHWVRFIAEYLTGHPTCGAHDNPTDKPIFTNRFPSIFHPLAHVGNTLPHILYKSHYPYPLSEGSTIILLVRNTNEIIARYLVERPDKTKKRLREHLMLIKYYDEFSGAKMLIYYEDLLLNPEREILRIKHFLGASDTRHKTFMNHYDYYAYLSRHPIDRGEWEQKDSALNFNFHRQRLLKIRKKLLKKRGTDVTKQYTKFFHWLLAHPEYQQVKPYIARYM